MSNQWENYDDFKEGTPNKTDTRTEYELFRDIARSGRYITPKKNQEAEFGKDYDVPSSTRKKKPKKPVQKSAAKPVRTPEQKAMINREKKEREQKIIQKGEGNGIEHFLAGGNRKTRRNKKAGKTRRRR
jgi:hypothetical protein